MAQPRFRIRADQPAHLEDSVVVSITMSKAEAMAFHNVTATSAEAEAVVRTVQWSIMQNHLGRAAVMDVVS